MTKNQLASYIAEDQEWIVDEWVVSIEGDIVDGQIYQTRDGVDNIFELYAWMRKLQIMVNWETKEIYLDNENLRVDSSGWEVKQIKWHNVKVNPEWDITEYLDWPEVWQQLFYNKSTLEREAKKMWKRLPFAHNENKEFQAIIDIVGIKHFMKIFPGCRYIAGSDFCLRGDIAYFWSASLDGDRAYSMIFNNRWDTRLSRDWNYISLWFSVRLVKDIAS
jgi:hypothetical protein